MKLASQTFATLGHPGRLAIFRLLMRFAPDGVRPTEMAVALGVKQNTLSNHLSDLEQAGLIAATRDGRSVYYRAAMGTAADLIGYLANDCCRGRPDICLPLSYRKEDLAMTPLPFNVLFLCSGNSARSIFAEALLRDLGGDRFAVYSAGTRPGAGLNAYAIAVLQRGGHAVDGLRSKHIAEFQTPDAPRMDFVFTVCDTAAAEECAPWPGQPMTAHWGLPDPARASGTDAEKALAFANTYAELRRRIMAFTALPFTELEKVALQSRLDDIHRLA